MRLNGIVKSLRSGTSKAHDKVNHMRRTTVILVVVLALAGAAFFLWKSHFSALEKERLEANDKIYKELGAVVFAIQDIKQGDLISATSLEERIIPVNKMPDHVATGIAEVAGRKARYGITNRDMVSLYDLDPYPPDLPVTAVVAIKEIRKGKVIMDDAVDLIRQSEKELPKHRIERMNMVIGRRATRDIARLQIVRTEDIFP